MPAVTSRDAYWQLKKDKTKPKIRYEDIAVPKNTGIAFIIGAISVVVGLCIIAHLYGLALASLIAIIGLLIYRASDEDTYRIITAKEVAHNEKSRKGTM